MQTNENIKEVIERGDQPFDILHAFSRLTSRRKVLLCDRLFLDNRAAFQQAASTLWPDADPRDLKKLEQFLYDLKKAH